MESVKKLRLALYLCLHHNNQCVYYYRVWALTAMHLREPMVYVRGNVNPSHLELKT